MSGGGNEGCRDQLIVWSRGHARAVPLDGLEWTRRETRRSNGIKVGVSDDNFDDIDLNLGSI
jgi:hypothetical protein